MSPVPLIVTNVPAIGTGGWSGADFHHNAGGIGE
jgi:hypothetical protein